MSVLPSADADGSARDVSGQAKARVAAAALGTGLAAGRE
jgi:hypothetical protein